MPVRSHRLSVGKPSNAPAEQANPPRAPQSPPPGGAIPTATVTAGSRRPGPPAPPGVVSIYPWEQKRAAPPPGSNRCRVKPKAEPPSGRPREGEFSSPVTARRTARRASRPLLPKCHQQPRPPQDHRARPSRIMPRGTPAPASTQLHQSPVCPPSFSISYLTPWPPARSQRSLCTWPHPAHLCCGGSRKGVSGLERSGEAETPFLKARRRATNHHRAGGQGVRLGVRLIDEHPGEHARQADAFACALGLLRA